MDQLRVHKLDGKTIRNRKEECQQYFSFELNFTATFDTNGGISELVHGFFGMVSTPHGN